MVIENEILQSAVSDLHSELTKAYCLLLDIYKYAAMDNRLLNKLEEGLKEVDNCLGRNDSVR